MKNTPDHEEYVEQFRDHLAKTVFSATLDAALTIFKNLILVNGGALAASLTYIATTSPLPGSEIALAAKLFAVGLLLAMIALAAYYYHNAAQTDRIFTVVLRKETFPKEKPLTKIVGFAVDALGWLSLLTFAVGLYFGGSHLQS